MPTRGYKQAIYAGDPYELRVGWYSYHTSKKASSAAEGADNSLDASLTADGGGGATAPSMDESTHYMALLITKKIRRTETELAAAAAAGKSLATEFSIALPASLIRKACVAFAYIHQLNGGLLLPDDAPVEDAPTLAPPK